MWGYKWTKLRCTGSRWKILPACASNCHSSFKKPEIRVHTNSMPPLKEVSQNYLQSSLLFNKLRIFTIISRMVHLFSACIWDDPNLKQLFEYGRPCGIQLASRRLGLYRSYTGTCNNWPRRSKHYGMAGLPFSRLLLPNFNGEQWASLSGQEFNSTWHPSLYPYHYSGIILSVVLPLIASTLNCFFLVCRSLTWMSGPNCDQDT